MGITRRGGERGRTGVGKASTTHICAASQPKQRQPVARAGARVRASVRIRARVRVRVGFRVRVRVRVRDRV